MMALYKTVKIKLDFRFNIRFHFRFVIFNSKFVELLDQIGIIVGRLVIAMLVVVCYCRAPGFRIGLGWGFKVNRVKYFICRIMRTNYLKVNYATRFESEKIKVRL